MNMLAIITARKLHKKFGDLEVLRGISLDIQRGEFVSIMGPSGSGKSTLLYCLSGILSSDSGSVLYKEKEVTRLSVHDRTVLRRTDFGFIFQFGELVSELPVRDNVALPLLFRGVNKKKAYHIAEQWIDIVGATAIIRSLPQELSGGETQRVAIARAMAIDPEVIFADEPTGSLDSSSAKEIMKLFVTLKERHGKTIIMVTHSEEAALYSDRIVRMRDGMVEPNQLDEI